MAFDTSQWWRRIFNFLGSVLVSTQVLIVVLLALFANSAQAQLSLESKKIWLKKFENCQQDCRWLSLSLLEKLQTQNTDSYFSIKSNAKATLYYLHSFTLNPRNEKDNFQFLKKMDQNPELNIVAPVLTAHHTDSSPADFFSVQPDDWILDAELGLHLARGLGEKVIFQGFSLGAILGTYLANKYPSFIDRLVLTSPPFMIVANGDELACWGQESFVQKIAKIFSSYPPEYLEKYLNGACPLSQLIVKVRNLHGPKLSLEINTEHDLYSNRRWIYQNRLKQIENWGRSIPQKTLIIYSEADGIIVREALKRFSKNLKGSQIVVYRKEQKVGHVATFKNQPVVGTGRDIYEVMNSFILSR